MYVHTCKHLHCRIALLCTCKSICPECRVSWVQIPPEATHFHFFIASGVFLSFFLSISSVIMHKHNVQNTMYMYMHKHNVHVHLQTQCTCTCTNTMYMHKHNVHVHAQTQCICTCTNTMYMYILKHNIHVHAQIIISTIE